jgi:hypothetical protein
MEAPTWVQEGWGEVMYVVYPGFKGNNKKKEDVIKTSAKELKLFSELSASVWTPSVV